ncbi:ParA family protein [Pasteurella multocida]|uniref:ParA family protein n=2 Tax=Pasteurella multocida TaxID=747 RepID=UPI0035F3D016
MKVFTIANQKGGVGKTSFATHFAFYLIEKGMKGVFIDLDTQVNASYTLGKTFPTKQYAHTLFSENPNIELSESGLTLLAGSNELSEIYNNTSVNEVALKFYNSVNQLKDKGIDFCIIDTAPSLNSSLVAALVVSDYVICPIEPEKYALQGIGKMINLITNVKKQNTKLEFLGILISKINRRSPRHIKHNNELLENYPDSVLPQSIGLRDSIAEAVDIGIPVWKIKKTAARAASKEIRSVIEYILSKVNK